MKRVALMMVASLAVASCASSPSPVWINGRYYMAGDSGCARYTQETSTRIQCYNKKGEAQGWEDAISSSEMAAYNHRQAVARQQISELADQLTATSNQIAEQNRASAVAYNQATRSLPTTTQPIGPQQTQTTCLVNGNYVACRTRPQ